MRSRLVLILAVLCAITLSVVFGCRFVCYRICEYDRWKTTGFGIHQIHRGMSCFFQCRDESGAVVVEQCLTFHGENIQINPTSDVASDGDWINQSRERIEQLRQERELGHPEYLGQALCQEGQVYYGAAPITEFTKTVHFAERTALLFTPGGSAELKTIQSEGIVFIFPPTGRPALAVELSRSPGKGLECRFRRFESLSAAQAALCARYSWTNFEQAQSRVSMVR